jgi:hypothetical protein
MRNVMTMAAALVLAAAPLAGAPPAQAKEAELPTDLVNITAVRSKMKLVTDGAGHYMAFVPFGRDDLEELMFWGDGKHFWQIRRIGYGAEGDIRFDVTFWEPRVAERWKASFEFKDKKYNVRCDDRVTDLKLVDEEEARKILDGGTFHKPRWRHQSYALARDEMGTYYFVDQEREPAGNKNFRVFIGQKGAMKPAKMKNIVSDSEGDIFITKNGQLRLILDKNESSWTKGKKTTKLLVLPIEQNVPMIYNELGQYSGQPLGTPCDDV